MDGRAVKRVARTFIMAGAAAIAMVFAAANAHATDHALLIGVTDYPNLPKRLWLKGPANDVALMGDTLQALGFEAGRIQKLVSRLGGNREPTRANIVQAMARLRAEVQPGDHVVLYFAGHGSQQPQPADHGKRPTEPDGLDEVFLPADVDRWQGAGSPVAIPNALLDDEVGEWIDSVVDRGATVWAIFDTCHAGGMARGRGARVRAVPPVELGLPMPKRSPVAATPRAAQAFGRDDGRVLAFAARAHEAAGEEWLPQGVALGASQMHGVFTFHLAQSLKFLPTASPAALARAVRTAYVRERRVGPTPQFNGNMGIPLR